MVPLSSGRKLVIKGGKKIDTNEVAADTRHVPDNLDVELFKMGLWTDTATCRINILV